MYVAFTNVIILFGIHFIFFLGETYMKLSECSRGGQNSISTILLIVSFM